MSLSPPEGMLLIVHSQIYPINEKDILLALPVEQQRLQREVVRIDQPQLRLAELDTVDWEDAKRTQTRIFEERLKPALEKYSAYRVAYFGLAPVPLAIHFGYLFGAMRPVDIYQQHRDDKSWVWHGRTAQQPEPPKLLPMDLPREKYGGRGEAILRISTSYQISAEDTAAVVQHPVRAIDVQLESTALDALSLSEDIELVSSAFRDAVNALANCLPNLETIHVFAAVPVGVAFRLGTCLNPTLQHQFQTYQYFGSGIPRYRPAFTLKGSSGNRLPLSPDDVAAAQKLRQKWSEEAQSLKRFSERQQEAHKKGQTSWLSQVLPEPEHLARIPSRWHGLPCIFETPLSNSRVALDGQMPQEVFSYDDSVPCWRLSDRMLLDIQKQFPEEEVKFRRASRLFLAHEAVHVKAHRLTSQTARWIGRLPKILEEIDYQADVWAILHEYAFMRMNTSFDMPSPHDFFVGLVDVVLSTIWAFGETDVPISALPVRRINRYLQWFWQCMRIALCSQLPDILDILADRPLIELSGLPMKVHDGEFCYLLQQPNQDFLEIGVLHENRVKRLGHTHVVRLGEAITGFRERNRQQVRTGLQGAFDSIVS